MARRGDGIYKRGNAWRLDFTHNGQRHTVSLGRNINRSTAQEIAAVARAKILRGEAGIGRKRHKDMVFDEAVEEFLAAKRAIIRPHTLRSYQQALNKLLEKFSGKRLSQIHPFLIEKHKQRRLSEGAPVGFNREHGTLKALFNWFIDKGKFEGINPVRKVKKVKESKGRDRFLEPEEEEQLLAQCSEPLRTIVMCGIYAGLRIPSETLSLEKTDVDLRRGLLTIQGAFAKNGQTAQVPLNPKLREALARLMAKRQDSPYVFIKEDGEPYKSVQNIFRSACKRAGLIGVSPHIMRHTFASRLSERGVDLRTIQELGRWADIRMVQRYANVSERHKREAIGKLSETPSAESWGIRLADSEN